MAAGWNSDNFTPVGIRFPLRATKPSRYDLYFYPALGKPPCQFIERSCTPSSDRREFVTQES